MKLSLSRFRPMIMIALLVLSGCGQSIDKADKAHLLVRANQFWEAIRLGDYYTAYNLEAETAAGHLRPDQVELRKDYGMKLVNYQLGEVRFYEDNNKAEIDVTKELTMLEFEGHTFSGGTSKDYWTFIKGDWYHGEATEGTSGLRQGR